MGFPIIQSICSLPHFIINPLILGLVLSLQDYNYEADSRNGPFGWYGSNVVGWGHSPHQSEEYAYHGNYAVAVPSPPSSQSTLVPMIPTDAYPLHEYSPFSHWLGESLQCIADQCTASLSRLPHLPVTTLRHVELDTSDLVSTHSDSGSTEPVETSDITES